MVYEFEHGFSFCWIQNIIAMFGIVRFHFLNKYIYNLHIIPFNKKPNANQIQSTSKNNINFNGHKSTLTKIRWISSEFQCCLFAMYCIGCWNWCLLHYINISLPNWTTFEHKNERKREKKKHCFWKIMCVQCTLHSIQQIFFSCVTVICVICIYMEFLVSNTHRFQII